MPTMESFRRWADGLYLVAFGIAFIANGVISLGKPDFWNAVTPFDYAAVWTYSAALLLAGPATLILASRAGARDLGVAGWIVAAGAVTASVANALEDAFHLGGFGPFTSWACSSSASANSGSACGWRETAAGPSPASRY